MLNGSYYYERLDLLVTTSTKEQTFRCYTYSYNYNYKIKL